MRRSGRRRRRRSRRRPDRIAAAFLELEKMYPDFIYCQEIYNEPENWPPTAVETDLVPFAALVARVRRTCARRDRSSG